MVKQMYIRIPWEADLNHIRALPQSGQGPKIDIFHTFPVDANAAVTRTTSTL